MYNISRCVKSQFHLFCFTAATDKVALVIGNQDYAHRELKGLQYIQRDAADVAEALIHLKFKVFENSF